MQCVEVRGKSFEEKKWNWGTKRDLNGYIWSVVSW